MITITLDEGLSGRVTLRKGANGEIVCETKPRTDTRDPAPKSAEVAGRAAPAAEVVARRSTPAPARPAAAAAGAKGTEKAREPAKPKERRASSLNWKPHSDKGYSGFIARTEAGRLTLLKSKTSQWALFIDRLDDEKPKLLGCFLKEGEAKQEAQKFHDAPRRSQPLLEEALLDACPMPSGASVEAPTRAKGTRGKAKVVEPPANAEAETEIKLPDDDAMMASLKATLGLE